MAASDAVMLDAGGRELRVSSPDARDLPGDGARPAEVTKLQVVEYYLAVGDGIMRALGATARRRSSAGRRACTRASSCRRARGAAATPSSRSACPKGAPDYVETARIEFPSGRHADEVCPTELAVVGWCAQMGTITFHPWPVRRDDVDHPDELRIDLDPQPGTDFADAVRVAAEARELLAELGYAASRRPRAAAASTSTCGSSRAGPSPTSATRPSRSGASSSAACPARSRRSGGRRSAGSACSSTTTRTRATARSPPPTASAPKPGAPVSAPLEWDELPEVAPEDFTVATMPARFADVGDRYAAIDDVAHSLEPLLEMYERDESEGRATCPTRPTTRRCRASRSACSPRATGTASASRRR